MNDKETGQEEEIPSVEEVIRGLKKEHEEMREALKGLLNDELTKAPIFEDSAWTIKDILAHVSAWHWQLVEDVNLILNNKKPWYVGEEGVEDEFNKREVERRKDWPIERVSQEWEDSLVAVIQRIEPLTNEEWTRKTSHTWEDGTPLTVHSLFEYDYECANHEGGHAKQIIDWRKLHQQSQ